MTVSSLAVVVMTCAIASHGVAQRTGVFASAGLGAAKADTIAGVQVNATFTARNRWIQLAVIPLDVIVHAGDAPPRPSNEFGVRRTVCRDADDGPFTDRNNCPRTATRISVAGSVGVRVPRTLAFVGVGGRVSRAGTQGFGTVSVNWWNDPRRPWSATAQIGQNYVSGVIAIGTRLSARP